MKYWKYGTKKSVSELKSQDLNTYGKLGWELVSIIYCEYIDYTYYFKREKI